MKCIISLIILLLASTISSCDRSDMYKCWEFTTIVRTTTYSTEGVFSEADTAIATECGLTVIDAEIKAKKGTTRITTENSIISTSVTFVEK